ncbi:MAG TPA: PilZ domain-containing protein [Anaeromyxobacter sp.]|nr:PilZ domain-containing protein [Anaeromyxobacter sp.]
MRRPEKRRYLRYDLRSTLELSTATGREAFETVDLGAGGCRIFTGRPFEEGLVVTVQLSSQRPSQRPRGTARVVWGSQAEPFQVGLAFDNELAEQVVEELLSAVPIHTGHG